MNRYRIYAINEVPAIIAKHRELLEAFGYGEIVDGEYIQRDGFVTSAIYTPIAHPSGSFHAIKLEDIAGTKYALPQYRNKINHIEDIAADFLTTDEINGLKDDAYMEANGWFTT